MSADEPSSGRFRRLSQSIGLLDQGLFSLSNFFLTVFVARSSSATEFGSFSIVIATFLICLFACRGLTSESFVVRYSTRSADWVGAARGSVGLAGLLGVPTAIAVLAAGALAGGFDVAVAVAVLAPGLLSQDALRYVAFARRRPGIAALSDGVVLVGQGAASISLMAFGDSTATEMVLAWGISTWAAGALSAFMLRVLPRPDHAFHWLSSHRDLVWRYALDNVAAQGTNQAITFGVAIVAGLEAAGALRAAQSFFGPITVVYAGVMATLTPELVRLRAISLKGFVRTTRALSFALALAGLAAGGAVVLLSGAVGDIAFGATWEGAAPLVLWLALMQVPSGWRVGSMAALRALAAARATLRARARTTPIGLIGPIVGAHLAGALGAAIAMSALTPVQAVIWWWTLRKAIKASEES